MHDITNPWHSIIKGDVCKHSPAAVSDSVHWSHWSFIGWSVSCYIMCFWYFMSVMPKMS